MNFIKTIILSVLTVIILLSTPAVSQTYWMDHGGKSNIKVEMFKGKFEDERISTLTSTWFIKGRFQLDHLTYLIADLPVSNLDVNEDKVSQFSRLEDETMIGNPYIGIERKLYRYRSDQHTTIRIGIRPPIASNEKRGALETGWLSTYNRAEAFLPDYFSLNSSVGFNYRSKRAIDYTVNLGGTLLIPTEDNFDTELFLDYNLTLWFLLESVTIASGVAGRLLATDDDFNFGESATHQVGFEAAFKSRTITPAVHVRLFLDDFNDFVDFVYGFSLKYRI